MFRPLTSAVKKQTLDWLGSCSALISTLPFEVASPTQPWTWKTNNLYWRYLQICTLITLLLNPNASQPEWKGSLPCSHWSFEYKGIGADAGFLKRGGSNLLGLRAKGSSALGPMLKAYIVVQKGGGWGLDRGGGVQTPGPPGSATEVTAYSSIYNQVKTCRPTTLQLQSRHSLAHSHALSPTIR